ncbi:MAG TPA: hypothetical protein VFU61_08055, partial [Steroidobacteraceae bacterium]|nr:hypothetical protein [Steroidobacteraceae bacterium]
MMRTHAVHTVAAIVIALFLAASIPARPAAAATTTATAAGNRPWLNPALSPDERARLAVRAMTEEEKLGLVFAYFGSLKSDASYGPPPGARMG